VTEPPPEHLITLAPGDPGHVPLIKRVLDLEDRTAALADALDMLTGYYNKFAADVTEELGL
jgi:hypothetical protein